MRSQLDYIANEIITEAKDTEAQALSALIEIRQAIEEARASSEELEPQWTLFVRIPDILERCEALPPKYVYDDIPF